MRDVLTEEECAALGVGYWCSAEMLQAAARLGAERERERCLRIADNYGIEGRTGYEFAEAIRRGEEGQAWPCD